MIFDWTMKTLQRQSAPSSTSIPTRQHINNGISRIPMSMPFKPSTMTQGSMLSNARQVYRKDSGGGPQWYGASDYTYIKKITAIGKNAKTVKPWVKREANGVTVTQPAALAHKSQDRNTKNSRLQRCRAGGSVAPKKKGSLGNTFKSGGCCGSSPGRNY